MAQHVDDIAFIHSCFTETNNHSPALFQINTGMSRMGFPCVGAWVTYGLGTENQNLPAFVAMYDTLGRGLPKGHAQNWGAGFLPGVYQGTALNAAGRPHRQPQPPRRNDRPRAAPPARPAQASQRSHYQQEHEDEAELAARIESFELAYRMQMAAPEALDLDERAGSDPETLRPGQPEMRPLRQQCLMARRLVERGVRFVQIYSGGMENERSWDGHIDIAGNHRQFAGETDSPIGGLLTDLKQRGLLDSTLVIWGGEFGRLPVSQRTKDTKRPAATTTRTPSRPGSPAAASRAASTTARPTRSATRRRWTACRVNDLHATILHLLGLDHTKLTYKYNGRNFRLTDVAGEVVKKIIA